MKSLRKLVPAFSLLLVSAIILSSASFAWFTMSRQVTANGMDVTVTAPNNLLIDDATDGTAVGNAETDAVDWSEEQTIKVADVTLVPASTVNGTGFFVLKSDSPAQVAGQLYGDKSELVAGEAALTAAEANALQAGDPAKTGAYYDFKYRVKTEGGENVDVALTELTIAPKLTSAGDGDKVTYRGVTYENAAAALAAQAVTDSLKPVRVAILVGDAKNPTTVAPKGNVATAALYNMNTGVLFSEAAQDGPKNAISATKAAADPIPYGAVVYQTAVSAVDNLNAPADTVFTVLGTGAAKYVTVRVWFEGEDTKCNAADAAKAEFSVKAVFNAIG